MTLQMYLLRGCRATKASPVDYDSASILLSPQQPPIHVELFVVLAIDGLVRWSFARALSGMLNSDSPCRTVMHRQQINMFWSRANRHETQVTRSVICMQVWCAYRSIASSSDDARWIEMHLISSHFMLQDKAVGRRRVEANANAAKKGERGNRQTWSTSG